MTGDIPTGFVWIIAVLLANVGALYLAKAFSRKLMFRRILILFTAFINIAWIINLEQFDKSSFGFFSYNSPSTESNNQSNK